MKPTPWNSPVWSGPPEGRCGRHWLDEDLPDGYEDCVERDERLIFLCEGWAGQYRAMNWKAGRALRHYGFIEPLDSATFEAFEELLFRNRPKAEVKCFASEEDAFEDCWQRGGGYSDD